MNNRKDPETRVTKRAGGGNRTWLRVFLLLLAGGAVLSVAARLSAGFAEWYSTHIYPVLVDTVGRTADAVSVSAAETFILLLPILLVLDIAVSFRRRKSSGRRFYVLRTLGKHVLLLAAALFFLYEANCGVNYYRSPFVPDEVFRNASFTEDQLADFCGYAVTRLNDTGVCGLSGGETGTYPSGRKLEETARTAVSDLGSDYPALSGYYPHPKQLTTLSRFFSMMGVTGVYSPFTVEANLNGEMPAFNKPFTACHELSHLRGFMNEGEANYIGWLACIGSDNPAFRRSGWIHAFIYAGRELRKTDPERYAALREKLPEDVIRELDENNAFWAERENKASEIQDQVNDAYLKANGQADGVRTYDHLTTLMLIWYYEKDPA